MKKFAIYIINLDDGIVEGTNDVEVAGHYLDNNDYVILHAQHGVYFCGDRTEQQVHAVPEGVEAEEDEEGDG